jgi:hypothetical protein
MTMSDSFRDTGKNIREMFPEQTNSVLSIIIWTVLFLIDIAIVFYVAHLLGFDITRANNKNVLTVYLVLAGILLGIEIFLHRVFRSLFR